MLEEKTRPAKASARQRWTVDVDVYLESVVPLLFHVESPIQSAPDRDLVFHNNRHPGFDVVFHFHDDTGDPDGYRFVDDKQDAVWSQKGEGPTYCPTVRMNDIFQPLRLTEDRMTLVAFNPNSGDATGKFQYALNVTNGSRTVSIDPGGDNMNGSTGKD